MAALHSSIVIKTKSDATKLLQLQRRLHVASRPQVLIRVEGLRDQEAREWEDKLDSLREECGCRSGAIAVVIFIFAAVSYGLFAAPYTPIQRGGVILDTVVFLVGLSLSAIIGKSIGLFAASKKYRYICAELVERVRSL